MAAPVTVHGTLNSTLTQVNGANNASLQIGKQSSLPDTLGADVDDIGVWSRALSAQEMAIVHAMGRFEGWALDAPFLDDALSAFATQTQFYTGTYTGWEYVTGLPSTTVGMIGGSLAGLDAWVVLNTSGTGLRYFIPEPASLALLGLGLLGLGRRRRRAGQ